MRLPWLQVNQDGLTRARSFGRLMGIGEAAGIEAVLRLWAWALEMAPDGDFSGTVLDARALTAGAGLNPPDAERVVLELQRVGLVATTPSLRVRGLDRYESAWKKNRRKSGGRPPVSALVSDGSAEKPERKTETETETETEKKEALALTPSEPSPPRSKADPRLKPLTDRLVATFEDVRGEKYLHGGAKDAQGLKRLLPVATDDEIDRRWRVALGQPRDAWLSCSTFAQLARKWPDLSATPGPPRGSAATSYEPWTAEDDFLAGISGGRQ